MPDKEVKLAVSDFNLQAITTTDYEEILKGTIESGSNIAAFGRRGSGKTEIAKQVIASTEVEGRKVREVYINLSVAERVDMGGYPDLFGATQGRSATDAEKKEHFVRYLLPMFFEPMIHGTAPVVVCFDEADKADNSILAPLLEILQFKSINHRPLPNLQTCILTGNLISEGSQRPSLPLLDRTEKYLLQADTSSFLSWAAKSNRIHPSIRALLNDKASLLYGSNDGGGDLYAEPSPRSWENASKVLMFGEKNRWSKELMYKKVAGFVGKQAGLDYQIYFEHYQELLPMIGKVFAGESVLQQYNELDPSKRIYAAMIVCSRLAGILDAVPQGEDAPQYTPKELGYVGKFMEDVSSEDLLISVRTQFTLKRIVRWELENNKDWSKDSVGFLMNVANTVN